MCGRYTPRQISYVLIEFHRKHPKVNAYFTLVEHEYVERLERLGSQFLQLRMDTTLNQKKSYGTKHEVTPN